MDNLQELGENIIDSIAELDPKVEMITQFLPMTKVIFGSFKAIRSLKDKIFLRKLLIFLNEINKVNPDKRNEFVEKLRGNKKLLIETGEIIIFQIDKSDSVEKAKIIGQIFSIYIDGMISRTLFLKLTWSINSISTPALMELVNKKTPIIFQPEYIAAGFMEYEYTPLKLAESNYQDSKLDIKRSELYIILINILDNNIEMAKAWGYSMYGERVF